MYKVIQIVFAGLYIIRPYVSEGKTEYYFNVYNPFGWVFLTVFSLAGGLAAGVETTYRLYASVLKDAKKARNQAN